ncbi:hypothetical protein BDW74DRAFT_86039 [Aspergillus multicolor]|uniref:uncharacterized protein n=1 Tax=Aspergillus multicolor TaxID=41759 RepID=UPI003CCDBC70
MYVLPVIITFVSVATLAVALRLFTRIRLVSRTLWWDDWFLVLALMTDYAFFGVLLTEHGDGLGKPETSLSPETYRNQLKMLYFSVPLYNLSLSFTKVSICLLYMRLFTTRTYQIMLKVLLISIVCVGLYMVIGTLLICYPLHTFWYQENMEENCVSREVTWYLTAVLQIVGDLVLVVLPMPQVSKLRIPTRQKVCLIMVFALGLLYVLPPSDNQVITGHIMTHILPSVVATSAARFQALVRLVQSNDVTRNNGFVATWSFVEVNTAIVCASLSVMRQLIIRTFPRLIPASARRTYRKTHSRRSEKRLHDPSTPWEPYRGPASYSADVSVNASIDRDSSSHIGDSIQVVRELRWELETVEPANDPQKSDGENPVYVPGLGLELEPSLGLEMPPEVWSGSERAKEESDKVPASAV